MNDCFQLPLIGPLFHYTLLSDSSGGVQSYSLCYLFAIKSLTMLAVNFLSKVFVFLYKLF